MKNSQIRLRLEKEILRLRAQSDQLNREDFGRYLACLKRLFELNRLRAVSQRKIYSYTYGGLGDFATEFLKFTSPLLHKTGKYSPRLSVLNSRTLVFFSPSLIELALGCIISELIKAECTPDISVFDTGSGAAISFYTSCQGHNSLNFACLRHIARLHGGKYMVGFNKNQCHIVIVIPRFPCFQPLKLVPCSTELCRLCCI